MTQLYRHSGVVPLTGVLRTAIVGIGAATFLAIIYSYALNYIPFVYLNLVMTFGFGTVVGSVVSREAQATKIRSGLVPAAIGLICGLAGLYAAWAVDLVARLGPPPDRGMFVGLDPRVMFAYMTWFYENGQWGIGRAGGVISGLPLAIVWLAEAGMIVGFATYKPWEAYRKNVFCESCQSWAAVEKGVVQLQVDDTANLVQRLHEGEFAVLRDAPRATAAAVNFVRLNLSCCTACPETNALEVEQVTVAVDKKGERSEKCKTIVNRLLLSAADVELIRELGAAVENPAPLIDAAEPPPDAEPDPTP